MSLVIHITSDTHIERYYPYVPDPKSIIPVSCDILVLAGDIGHCQYWQQYSAFIRQTCQKFPYVIIIPGNHEYYIRGKCGLTIVQINDKLKKLAESIDNLLFLNDSYVAIDSCEVIIFGTVLWSYIHKNKLPKYIPIRYGNKYINAVEWNYLHNQAMLSLYEAMAVAKEKNYKLIVISHYCPSFEDTIPPEYRNKNNDLYCSDLDHLLEDEQIQVWYYGHTGHNIMRHPPGKTCLYGNQHYEKDYKENLFVTIKKTT